MNTVKSPMAGSIVSVLVTEGQSFEAGKQIAMLEAMKMEIAVIAEVAGTVSAVLVSVGDVVEENQNLIEFI